MLFFAMLFVLGIGSIVGMTSTVITSIRDQFPEITQKTLAIIIPIIGFFIGLIYLTPGGQFIINLIDFYGASLIGLSLAVVELIGVGWIYGVNRICKDIEFMLGIKTGLYYRICWGIITPLMMGVILLYTIWDLQPVTYRQTVYPDVAYCKFVLK